MPRHLGLGEEWTPFFRKGARSNSAANSKLAIAFNRNAKLKFGNEARAPAREQPLTRETGALELDSI